MKNRMSLEDAGMSVGQRRNTSLVEKLNRTLGATPSSLPRGTLLTYEQIKKLPASRKPASELPRVTARP